MLKFTDKVGATAVTNNYMVMTPGGCTSCVSCTTCSCSSSTW